MPSSARKRRKRVRKVAKARARKLTRRQLIDLLLRTIHEVYPDD